MSPPIGVLGLGAWFPSAIRTNDWWPAELVERWMAERARRPPPALPADATEGMRRVIAAMASQARDPFQGARERRVIAAEDTLLDLEERAARRALEQAALEPREVDLVLTSTVFPDVLLSNPGAMLHARLGLSPACLVLQVEAAAYGFLAQLAVAEGMLASGRARHALLVQSCAATRFVATEDPGSVLLGDGASALVLGPVSAGRGLVGSVHFTDGRFPRTFVMSVPGGCWFDDGRPLLHVADPVQMRDVFLSTADVCKQSVDAILDRTGHAIGDLDFLCVFQGTPWLRELVHDYVGATAARSVETFTRYGYLSAAMIPTNLHVAVEQGTLRDGDLVVLTGGGTGVTYGATLLRWGR